MKARRKFAEEGCEWSATGVIEFLMTTSEAKSVLYCLRNSDVLSPRIGALAHREVAIEELERVLEPPDPHERGRKLWADHLATRPSTKAFLQLMADHGEQRAFRITAVARVKYLSDGDADRMYDYVVAGRPPSHLGSRC